MRKIDITTSQNVTIEYELATLMDRIVATVIDFVIVYLGSLIIYGIIMLLKKGTAFNYFFVVAPASFFYHLLMEAINQGQSVGKMISKIRVVKINGEQPGFFNFLMRTIFRFLDITSTAGTLALITISSSEKGQRLGDFFAETTLIKVMNFNRFSLNRILTMEQLKDYTPLYPGVVQFKEEEMLLIKETLDRCKTHPNDSHLEAKAMLVKRIESQLGVVAPKDKDLFLNTLIKDYVSLTR